MSVIQPVIEKMQQLIPVLPEDWAARVGKKLGISEAVARHYAAGRRGKRDKNKALDILRAMKEVEAEFQSEIETLIQ